MKKYGLPIFIIIICSIALNFTYTVGFKVADSSWFDCVYQNNTRVKIYVCGSKIKR